MYDEDEHDVKAGPGQYVFKLHHPRILFQASGTIFQTEVIKGHLCPLAAFITRQVWQASNGVGHDPDVEKAGDHQGGQKMANEPAELDGLAISWMAIPKRPIRPSP